MNIDRPHNIIPEPEVTKDRAARERFMPLTDEEYKILAPMTPDERHKWLKDNMPTKERLARHLGAEGLHDMAYNARQGLYSDFESPYATPKIELVKQLKDKARFDLVPYVTSGEYDDNKAESDKWAREQVGEIGMMCDKLGLR